MTNKQRNRDPVVARNIKTWQTIIQRRYREGEGGRINELLAPNYQWYGPAETNYGLEGNDYPESLLKQSQQLVNALNGFSISHDMFGEGAMLANRYFISGKHDQPYGNIPASGNRVNVYAIAIARFDPMGRLVEERECWDELEFLKQIGAVKQQDATDLLSAIPEKHAHQLLENRTDTSEALPSIKSLLFDNHDVMPEIRDSVVERNEQQWRAFLQKKFDTQDFSTLFDVVSPKWHWHAPAGVEIDLSEPGAVANFVDDLIATKKCFPDITFHSQVFGEGNRLLYHVVCEFTHSAEMFGVPATGKVIRQNNLAVCYCDQQGRVAKEWEIYDMLSVYKQLGVIHNDSQDINFHNLITSFSKKDVG